MDEIKARETIKAELDNDCWKQQQERSTRNMSVQRCDGEHVNGTCFCCKRFDDLAARIADELSPKLTGEQDK